MKASPLLRAWMARLSELGVQLRTRHRLAWLRTGWRSAFRDAGWRNADQGCSDRAGSRWRFLAAAWVGWHLARASAWHYHAPFVPSNMGFAIAWSDHLRARFAGTPLKRIALPSAASRNVARR
jgi:predicted flavoprotein YhiN